ncbi:MAG: hypothetical protein Q4A15_00990 [Prevotellaceae bacterium]|nr:hypothetical protein [Prevotellaceae bacterium]
MINKNTKAWETVHKLAKQFNKNGFEIMNVMIAFNEMQITIVSKYGNYSTERYTYDEKGNYWYNVELYERLGIK